MLNFFSSKVHFYLKESLRNFILKTKINFSYWRHATHSPIPNWRPARLFLRKTKPKAKKKYRDKKKKFAVCMQRRSTGRTFQIRCDLWRIKNIFWQKTSRLREVKDWALRLRRVLFKSLFRRNVHRNFRVARIDCKSRSGMLSTFWRCSHWLKAPAGTLADKYHSLLA